MTLLAGALSAASAATTSATTLAGHASTSGSSLLDPIAKPIAWVLAEIYAIVPNYGVAIMVLSVLWMILISPLTLKSTRSMLAMQKLQPQLKKLQEQHKNDKQAFAQAQMDLFREHQVSPFGSCLPMLLPMPVFFALFRVIDGLSHSVKGPDSAIHCLASTCYDPKYLSPSTRMFHDIAASKGHLDAFGMNLANNAFSAHSGLLAALPFWILLLVMGATSYLQSAQMMSRNPNAQNNPQMRMMKFLPLVFVLFCIKFPAGVILYYAMSNVCRIAQQDAMYRFDPKVRALVAQEVLEVEALTHEIDERDAGGSGRKAAEGKGGSNGKGSNGKGSGQGGKAGAQEDGSRERPGPPASNPAAQGRTRFRDLLASAADQQQRARDQKARDQKAAAPRAPKASADPGGQGAEAGRAGSNGKPAAGSHPNGSRSSSAKGRSPSGGHRTNRKRRGK